MHLEKVARAHSECVVARIRAGSGGSGHHSAPVFSGSCEAISCTLGILLETEIDHALLPETRLLSRVGHNLNIDSYVLADYIPLRLDVEHGGLLPTDTLYTSR